MCCPSAKRTKRAGFRSHVTPQVCGVGFGGFPAWLWSLRLADWATILITNPDELRLRQYHVSTWTHFQSKLVIIPSGRVQKASVEVSVWFGSGQLSRLIEVEDEIDSTVPMCYWVINASRRPPKSSTENWTWVSINHARMGGSTTSRGLFGFRNITPPSLERDPIRRSIVHILKYSERPISCSPSFDGAHYTFHDQLSVHCLDKPVLFPSVFSYTGWGRRVLIPSELSQAFDLPSFLEWSDDFR